MPILAHRIYIKYIYLWFYLFNLHKTDVLSFHVNPYLRFNHILKIGRKYLHLKQKLFMQHLRAIDAASIISLHRGHLKPSGISVLDCFGIMVGTFSISFTNVKLNEKGKTFKSTKSWNVKTLKSSSYLHFSWFVLGPIDSKFYTSVLMK